MKTILPHTQEELVRTTVRLPSAVYKRAKRLSVELDTTLQQLIGQAIEQFEERESKRLVKDIFKHTVVFKPGKFPTKRSDYYNEYFNRKFGAPGQ